MNEALGGPLGQQVTDKQSGVLGLGLVNGPDSAAFKI